MPNFIRWLTAAAAFGLLAAATPARALDDVEIQKVADGAATRRDAMLREMLAKPYPPAGLWRSENFALAAYYLHERVEQANQALVEEGEQQLPILQKNADDGFHWHAYILERIYFLFGRQSRFFPGRMSAGAEKAVLEMLWQWGSARCRLADLAPAYDWRTWGSENHHAQAWSSLWGLAQIACAHPELRARRYADGSTPAQMAQAFDAYYLRFARERAAKGLLVECNSDYNKYTLGGWYNMADFAADPRLRRQMTMLLDLFWADWAVEQIDAVRGGSRHRCYPGQNSTSGTSMQGLAWYHFGMGPAKSKHPGHICGATSFYRPAPCVVDLALDAPGRGVYAYRSRRPGLAKGTVNTVKPPRAATPAHPLFDDGYYELNPTGGGLARYSWCTPDFVLGTSMVEAREQTAWTNISSQNRWEGVIFAGHKTARMFTQPLCPSRGSVYNAHWSVQDQGVLIVQRLKSSNARGQRVWFDGALKRIARDGWVFAAAPRAYAAVRVVSGATVWEPDSATQHRGGAGPLADGMWLKCEDEFAPVIMEVARQSDYGDFAAFQAAIIAHPLRWERPRLDYTSKGFGATLTLFADYSQPPLVNGTAVDYAAQQVYDSPFIQSAFGSGRVTIQKDSRKLILDFNNESR